MSDWKYERIETEFEQIPVGKYRCRIANAEMQTSKNGNDMIKLTLDISGKNQKVWDYIVFMPDHAEITNRKLTSVFDSFGLLDGDLNLSNWVGKVGACMVKIDENEYRKVNYYIAKKLQETMPAWVEPTTNNSGASISAPVTDEMLPF